VRKVDNSKDPGVDGRIILKWIFERLDGRAWTESIWLRIGTALVNAVINLRVP
jgi:hypothetical protein